MHLPPSPLQRHNSYRSDIDGLRAIAVASVLLFHVDDAWLPGGFVGVDIFFVISGFLITSKIVEDHERGRFSFGEFYRRRIRRILPAMFFVILSTLVAGQFILAPEDFSRLAKTAIASQLSAANIYFTYFLDVGYFASDARMEPLLHLWSLGVEEQFYLLWPVVLALSWTRVHLRPFMGGVIAFILFSFFLGQLLLQKEAMFAYYMLPTRAGQLLAGALVYFLTRQFSDKRSHRLTYETISLAGAALIAASLVMLTHESAFPGLNAVPVTLGASLVIFAGSFSAPLVGRVLATAPMVAFGAISYSLYLWHWPVLAFARYAEGGELTLATKLSALVVITVLSIFSYFAVEKPFRHDGRPFRPILIRQLLIPTAVITVVTGFVIQTSGFGIDRFNQAYVNALASLEKPRPASVAHEVCQGPTLTASDFQKASCKIGPAEVADTYLWGDSNGGHYVGFVSEIAAELGFTFRNAVHNACPPVLNEPERFVSQTRSKYCRISGQVAHAHLPAFKNVILAAAWDSYLRTKGNAFEQELSNTVSELRKAGKSVLILGQIPRLRSFNANCSRKALKLSYLDCEASSQVDRVRVDRTNNRLRKIAAQTGAFYYDANDLLCGSQTCSGYLNGRNIYFDPGHLTHEGSRLIGSLARKDRASLAPFEQFLGLRGKEATATP